MSKNEDFDYIDKFIQDAKEEVVDTKLKESNIKLSKHEKLDELLYDAVALNNYLKKRDKETKKYEKEIDELCHKINFFTNIICELADDFARCEYYTQGYRSIDETTFRYTILENALRTLRKFYTIGLDGDLESIPRNNSYRDVDNMRMAIRNRLNELQ